MKRVICLFLASLLALSLCACGGGVSQQPEQTTQPQVTAPKSLKVLAIGNSFSEDATKYLYQVAKAEGVEEVVIGNLFVGGCTLKMHAGYIKSGEAKYRYDKCVNGEWEKTPETTLLTGLQDEAWDVITMQQGSVDSGLVDTHQPYLDELVAYVRQNSKNPNAKLYWHMTWAYQEGSTHKAFPTYGNSQMTMYYGIVNVVQKVIEPNENFHGIIPVGTVIQNLRGSIIGDKLTRDGYHLNDLGRVAAAYTWYAVLADQKLQDAKYSVVHGDLIVKAVNAALDKPQAVTAVS